MCCVESVCTVEISISFLCYYYCLFEETTISPFAATTDNNISNQLRVMVVDNGNIPSAAVSSTCLPPSRQVDTAHRKNRSRTVFNEDRWESWVTDMLKRNPKSFAMQSDWAMKYLSVRHREMQSAFFGKRGILWFGSMVMWYDRSLLWIYRTTSP